MPTLSILLVGTPITRATEMRESQSESEYRRQRVPRSQRQSPHTLGSRPHVAPMLLGSGLESVALRVGTRDPCILISAWAISAMQCIMHGTGLACVDASRVHLPLLCRLDTIANAAGMDACTGRSGWCIVVTHTSHGSWEQGGTYSSNPPAIGLRETSSPAHLSELSRTCR